MKKAFNLILLLVCTTVAWSQQDSSTVNIDSIYDNPEITATYPGGPSVWQRYLSRNLIYPRAAEEKNIQGTVVVEFIVDMEGKVITPKAASGPRELRDEAVSLVKKSGRWMPAVHGGKRVKSIRKLPIKFEL